MMSPPLPMLIDVTRLAARLLEGHHPTGVDRVSLAYVARYRALARALVRHKRRWLFLRERTSQRLFDALLGQDPRPALTVRACVAQAHLMNWDTCHGSLFLNTGHSGLDDPAYAVAVRRHRVRPVYFLHDLIPLTHPEYTRPGEHGKHVQRLTTMLETGQALVLNSRQTCTDLTEYAQARRLPEHVIAPLGVESLPTPEAAPALEAPYFVMVGTIEPRKNHLLLLHLWRRMVERGDAPIPKLVLVGRRGWECEQVIDLLERCEALREHVIERSACDDRELATWLRHARALLFPSFVEGFGLPLVEALSMGTPVIASDLAVFRESAQAIPDYLDPLDGPAWERAIGQYVPKNSARRQAQLQRMQGFRRWTWEEHFDVVESLFERCLAVGLRG